MTRRFRCTREVADSNCRFLELASGQGWAFDQARAGLAPVGPGVWVPDAATAFSATAASGIRTPKC